MWRRGPRPGIAQVINPSIRINRMYTRPMEIGHVEAIFRYPVKSMGGERLDAATLGWHGVEGDRRLALRRLDDRGGFPWLTAGRSRSAPVHATACRRRR